MVRVPGPPPPEIDRVRGKVWVWARFGLAFRLGYGFGDHLPLKSTPSRVWVRDRKSVV